MMTEDTLSAENYRLLAGFRATLRRFLVFSEARAAEVGLTPQQHQALLAIRAAEPGTATVGYLAEHLILKPHSATGLVDRLVALGLLERQPSTADHRRVLLTLTGKADAVLADLAMTHREEIRRLEPLLSALLARIRER